MFIYSKRIKSKKNNPWKWKDVVKILKDEFIWNNVSITPRIYDEDICYRCIEGGLATLTGPCGIVYVKHNYTRYESDNPKKGVVEIEYEWDKRCAPNTAIIETNSDKVIKFLLSKPQFYTNG